MTQTTKKRKTPQTDHS